MKITDNAVVRRGTWGADEKRVLERAIEVLTKARRELGPDANSDLRLARAIAAVEAVKDGVVVVPPDSLFEPGTWPEHDPRDDLATWKLRNAAGGLKAAEQELERTVVEARQAGVSFGVIGAALGFTKQGARQMFLRAQDFGLGS